jgi:hypothetical protein
VLALGVLSVDSRAEAARRRAMSNTYAGQRSFKKLIGRG